MNNILVIAEAFPLKINDVILSEMTKCAEKHTSFHYFNAFHIEIQCIYITFNILSIICIFWKYNGMFVWL